MICSIRHQESRLQVPFKQVGSYLQETVHETSSEDLKPSPLTVGLKRSKKLPSSPGPVRLLNAVIFATGLLRNTAF